MVLLHPAGSLFLYVTTEGANWYLVVTGQSTGNGDAATPLRLDGPDSFLHLVVASPGSFLAPRPLPRERIPVRARRHPDVTPVRAVCFIPHGGSYAGLGA